MSSQKPTNLHDVLAWIQAHEVATEERWARISELRVEQRESDARKFTTLFAKLDSVEKHIAAVELRLMYVCGIGTAVGALGGAIFGQLIK